MPQALSAGRPRRERHWRRQVHVAHQEVDVPRRQRVEAPGRKHQGCLERIAHLQQHFASHLEVLIVPIRSAEAPRQVRDSRRGHLEALLHSGSGRSVPQDAKRSVVEGGHRAFPWQAVRRARAQRRTHSSGPPANGRRDHSSLLMCVILTHQDGEPSSIDREVRVESDEAIVLPLYIDASLSPRLVLSEKHRMRRTHTHTHKHRGNHGVHLQRRLFHSIDITGPRGLPLLSPPFCSPAAKLLVHLDEPRHSVEQMAGEHSPHVAVVVHNSSCDQPLHERERSVFLRAN